jgi:hypothetical protein
VKAVAPFAAFELLSWESAPYCGGGENGIVDDVLAVFFFAEGVLAACGEFLGSSGPAFRFFLD